MNSPKPIPAWPIVLVTLGVGLFSLGLAVITVLEDWLFAQAYLAQLTWQSLITSLHGQLQANDSGDLVGAILPDSTQLLVPVCCGGMLIWMAGSWVAARWSRRNWTDVARIWGTRGGRWLWLFLPWSQGRLVAYLLDSDLPNFLLGSTNEFFWGIVLALVTAEWWTCCGEVALPSQPATTQVSDRNTPQRWATAIIWSAFVVYALVYTAMNWGLWFNMRIPHGDSAMYEEHLWNVWHGKGFRSYLDQGLFLGEHIQVIHLLLLPLHLLWPSHLMLEMCQSLAIAATIFPVYSIAKRHTGRPLWAAVVGVVALLYFPLHYLDISIDEKTFRPTALAIPAVLAAIDSYEAGRLRRMLIWVLVGLSAQEDFAIVFGPLGLWMAWEGWNTGVSQRKWWGIGLLCGSAIYLLLVMKVLLPYFRSGVNIHYASYFTRFGKTPDEIIVTMLTSPLLVWQTLVNFHSLSWMLCLIVPLGGLPLLSPSRLLTAAPLFVLLCLNELAQQPPGPFHHFHAPIIPLILWSMAAGIGNLARAVEARPDRSRVTPGTWLAFTVTCALWTGACFSHHPLSSRFWDSGRSGLPHSEYWRDRYVPDQRPAEWANIASTIPLTANVASTDFVHPRLTHHHRSYDYSKYRRRVAGDQVGVPKDTDYIVIDTHHPYSWIHGPEDIRELQMEPDQWELLPDVTHGYFLVLKRKR